MSMTAGEAIKRIRNHMEVHRIGEYPHILIGEAFNTALAALQEKEELEKPPVTFGDQVRRMDDEALAWQFASLFAGGMGGVMEGIGMKANVEELLTMAYPRILAEVKGPAKLEKEDTLCTQPLN